MKYIKILKKNKKPWNEVCLLAFSYKQFKGLNFLPEKYFSWSMTLNWKEEMRVSLYEKNKPSDITRISKYFTILNKYQMLVL